MATNDPLTSLDGENYLSITSFRKDGTGVATPVWFAIADGTIYVMTAKDSWKVKRIICTPNVDLAPCTSRGKLLGQVFSTKAQVIAFDEGDHISQLMKEKYGVLFQLFRLMGRFRGQKAVYLAFKPKE